MSIPCGRKAIGPVDVPDCTPTCTRWGFINQGRPLKIYHDKTDWSPGYYVNFDAADPDFYMDPAIQAWNDAYPCGTLFERTDDPDQAEVYFRYVIDDGTIGEVNAYATMFCTCSPEGDACFDNRLHEDIFVSPDESQGNDGRVVHEVGTIFFSPQRSNAYRPTAYEWTNIYTHELGHALGMSHLPNSLGHSIMNSGGIYINEDRRIQPLDDEQLDLRYPCNCNLTRKLRSPGNPWAEMSLSHEHCETCATLHLGPNR